MCGPIVTFLHTSAFCIVCLQPRVNVPAQWMNAFSAMSGEKWAVRPFAKLHSTLVTTTSTAVAVTTTTILLLLLLLFPLLL